MLVIDEMNAILSFHVKENVSDHRSEQAGQRLLGEHSNIKLAVLVLTSITCKPFPKYAYLFICIIKPVYRVLPRHEDCRRT